MLRRTFEFLRKWSLLGSSLLCPCLALSQGLFLLLCRVFLGSKRVFLALISFEGEDLASELC